MLAAALPFFLLCPQAVMPRKSCQHPRRQRIDDTDEHIAALPLRLRRLIQNPNAARRRQSGCIAADRPAGTLTGSAARKPAAVFKAIACPPAELLKTAAASLPVGIRKTAARRLVSSPAVYATPLPAAVPEIIARLPAVAAEDVGMPGLLEGFFRVLDNWR